MHQKRSRLHVLPGKVRLSIVVRVTATGGSLQKKKGGNLMADSLLNGFNNSYEICFITHGFYMGGQGITDKVGS